MTKAQRLVVERMRAGHTLIWFGGNGPEMSGYALWPQRRTVQALLKSGHLRWGKPYNAVQETLGIIPLELTEAKHDGKP